MAALIDESTGKAAIFTVKQRPWYGLGITLENAQTGEEALTQAGLDWSVEKRQAYTTNKDGVIVPIPERFALHRLDTDLALGVVGPDYHPLQNRELFSVMDALVASKAAHYVSGGSLSEGRRVWAMLALDAGEIRVKKDDVALPYLLGGNGHDGWHSINFALTSTFVVCMNTYNRALTKAKSEGLLSKLRHTKNVGAKIDEVRETLGMIVEPFKELEEQANHLADKKITSTDLDAFLQ
jgi:phage/plasmid-like protein (TIGR03299 family)